MAVSQAEAVLWGLGGSWSAELQTAKDAPDNL